MSIGQVGAASWLKSSAKCLSHKQVTCRCYCVIGHPVYSTGSLKDCRSFRFIHREASNAARGSLIEGKNDNFPF